MAGEDRRPEAVVKFPGICPGRKGAGLAPGFNTIYFFLSLNIK